MLLQRIMGRISSNKNADIETDSFLLDPDSSKGMKDERMRKGQEKSNSVQLQKGGSVIVAWPTWVIILFWLSSNQKRTFACAQVTN